MADPSSKSHRDREAEDDIAGESAASASPVGAGGDPAQIRTKHERTAVGRRADHKDAGDPGKIRTVRKKSR